MEARKKLDDALGRNQVFKQLLMERGETIPGGKDEKGKGVIPPHKAAVGPMKALGMKMVGMRLDRVRAPDQKILPHTHEAATDAQKLTGSDLTEGDIQNMEYKASYYGTDLQCGGYKYGDETMTNDYGKEVIKNCHIMGQARYENLKKKGTGIALRNETLSHNLIERIPEMAARYPSMSRCRKESFDLFQPEDYDG